MSELAVRGAINVLKHDKAVIGEKQEQEGVEKAWPLACPRCAAANRKSQ
jgi:hypothetical protein